VRKVVLFIAISLDGFIAGPNDEIDWLFDDGDYGYKAFYETVDTIVMGRRTYDMALKFGEWPYRGKETLVFSRQQRENTEDVSFVSGDVQTLGAVLKSRDGGTIWLVGGGDLNTQFFRAHFVDEIVISIHPIILGSGIPLLSQEVMRVPLELVKHHIFDNGLVQLHFEVLDI
jgi:dihydrofolate reductase